MGHCPLRTRIRQRRKKPFALPMVRRKKGSCLKVARPHKIKQKYTPVGITDSLAQLGQEIQDCEALELKAKRLADPGAFIHTPEPPVHTLSIKRLERLKKRREKAEKG